MLLTKAAGRSCDLTEVGSEMTDYLDHCAALLIVLSDQKIVTLTLRPPGVHTRAYTHKQIEVSMFRSRHNVASLPARKLTLFRPCPC